MVSPRLSICGWNAGLPCVCDAGDAFSDARWPDDGRCKIVTGVGVADCLLLDAGRDGGCDVVLDCSGLARMVTGLGGIFEAILVSTFETGGGALPSTGKLFVSMLGADGLRLARGRVLLIMLMADGLLDVIAGGLVPWLVSSA